MNDIEIAPLRRDDLPDAAELLAQAFLDDPDVLAIVRGDVPKRLRVLTPHYYNLSRIFLHRGRATCAIQNGNLAGIMLFSAPGEEIPSSVDMLKMLLWGLIRWGPALEFRGMRSALDDEHCRPRSPHYYLSTIGVEPRLQGTGIGSFLLAHLTSMVDEDKAMVCLSSTNPKAIPLYEKFGFKTVLVTSPSGVPSHHMERTPQEKQ